ARTAPPREVAVDRAHRDLLGRVAHARAGLDASAAGRIDELGPGLGEDLEVALRLRIAANVLRAELDVEVDAVRDALALLHGLGQHRGVHIHVRLLAARARAAVRDVDLRPRELAQGNA